MFQGLVLIPRELAERLAALARTAEGEDSVTEAELNEYLDFPNVPHSSGAEGEQAFTVYTAFPMAVTVAASDYDDAFDIVSNTFTDVYGEDVFFDFDATVDEA